MSENPTAEYWFNRAKGALDNAEAFYLEQAYNALQDENAKLKARVDTTAWVNMDAGEPEQGVAVLVWLGGMNRPLVAYRDLDGWREILTSRELNSVTYWQRIIAPTGKDGI